MDSTEESMGFTQTSAIEVKQTKGKGRGVFARRLICDGEVIERVPVLVLPVGETKSNSGTTRMAGYCFEWGRGTVAVALGYGSLYNHSYKPNARYDDESGQSKVFRAIRDIAPGEEIVVNYNGEPEDETPVWFKVIDSETSQEEPERPDAHPRRNDETPHRNPHRNLSLVEPDLPAEGETEGVEQGDKSEDDR
jgi:SET domain-containing protein